MTKLTSLIAAVFSFGVMAAVQADQVSDMQRRLNEEVMSKPFSVESEANLNAALNAATERGKPTPTPHVPQNYGLGGLYQPYYGWGYGYGFGYYNPYNSYYYNNYVPYYSGLWW